MTAALPIIMNRHPAFGIFDATARPRPPMWPFFLMVILMAMLILGAIFSSGCTLVGVTKDDAVAIAREAGAAAAEKGKEAALDFALKKSDVVLDDIRKRVDDMNTKAEAARAAADKAMAEGRTKDATEEYLKYLFYTATAGIGAFGVAEGRKWQRDRGMKKKET